MTMTSIPLLLLQIFTLLVVFCSDDGADAFQTSFHNNMSKCHHQTQTIKSKRQPLITNLRMATTANSNNNNNDAAGDDNKAMAFLRKVGRVGGAANMDFATAMGLDESPSGGSKSSYHEGGFKVSQSTLIYHYVCAHAKMFVIHCTYPQ